MKYQGNELHLFKRAINWKHYFKSYLEPYIHGNVLEVGAGIGGTTRILCHNRLNRWLCLEPDPKLAEKIRQLRDSGRLPAICDVQKGTIESLRKDEGFDAILYIDVLEHIKEDAKELLLAKDHLNSKGYLIVLAPAHQFLFSDFDRIVGHYRRYDQARLENLLPPGFEKIETKILDSVGFFVSLSNRWLLKSSIPTQRQILIWDRIMIPMSGKVDPLLKFKFGKSILTIFQKNNEN